MTREQRKQIEAFKYWMDTNTEKGVSTIPEHMCKNIYNIAIKALEENEKLKREITQLEKQQFGPILDKVEAKIMQLDYDIDTIDYDQDDMTYSEEVHTIHREEVLQILDEYKEKDMQHDHKEETCLSDDAISRKAVLNTLFYKSDNNCEVVLNKELQDKIKALPPVSRWVPISEKLPESDGYYLVTEKNGRVCSYVFDKEGNSKEYWERCAVAWMPLPKSYNEIEYNLGNVNQIDSENEVDEPEL